MAMVPCCDAIGVPAVARRCIVNEGAHCTVLPGGLDRESGTVLPLGRSRQSLSGLSCLASR
jgi:hypothetical protein